MSVKIYNGYLLNIKPEEIFDKTNEIREKLSYVGMCLYADMINSILYEEYDRRSKGEEESIFLPDVLHRGGEQNLSLRLLQG